MRRWGGRHDGRRDIAEIARPPRATVPAGGRTSRSSELGPRSGLPGGAGARLPSASPPSPGPRHRPSRNQRRIVCTVGGCCGPGRSSSRRRIWVITTAGDSPAANRCSASCRSAFQEYEPGRVGVWWWDSTPWRNRVNARLRRVVRQFAASHTVCRDTTRSRPAREWSHPGSRWPAQSHTDTPRGRCRRARRPWPGPMQIAHAGVCPRRCPLSRLRGISREGSPRGGDGSTPRAAGPPPTPCRWGCESSWGDVRMNVDHSPSPAPSRRPPARDPVRARGGTGRAYPGAVLRERGWARSKSSRRCAAVTWV